MKQTGSLALAFDGHPPESLDAVERWAWSVIFGTFEGNEYDWKARDWKKRD